MPAILDKKEYQTLGNDDFILSNKQGDNGLYL